MGIVMWVFGVFVLIVGLLVYLVVTAKMNGDEHGG